MEPVTSFVLIVFLLDKWILTDMHFDTKKSCEDKFVEMVDQSQLYVAPPYDCVEETRL